MLDTNVTGNEIATLDRRRERLAGLPASVLCMPMMDAVAHADGNGHPLVDHYDTVGEMLSAGVRDVLTIRYVGKKKLSRLYAMLEGLMVQDGTRGSAEAADRTGSEAPAGRGEEALWERIRGGQDQPVILSEVARLVQIERTLSGVPAPDGSPRSSTDVMTQALAVYARMGSMMA